MLSFSEEINILVLHVLPTESDCFRGMVAYVNQMQIVLSDKLIYLEVYQ